MTTSSVIGQAQLVLRQRDIDGYSVSVGFRSKAQCAGNGHSLSKHCNAAAGPHGDALRVSLSAPMDGVAPLDKGSGHCLRGAPCHER
ncbi:MAG: hypothetical protein GY703_04125 [Gammaproteobacteria bacterium]|nr:hypothetical protein [Gammaproteobacteria bacterium]